MRFSIGGCTAGIGRLTITSPGSPVAVHRHAFSVSAFFFKEHEYSGTTFCFLKRPPNFFLLELKWIETQVAEEYWWAITQAAGRSCCGRSGSIVFDLAFQLDCLVCRGPLECDGTRAETRFSLSAKRTSPFKSAGGVSSVDYWQPRCAHQR